ncbi:MAG: hypothetical protein Q4E50_05725 [Tissierellia bacterium]|nr:hypothetical protein [Tissierellia bacterium]
MHIYFFKIEDIKKDAYSLKNFISDNFKKKSLVVNLSKENRIFEIAMGLEDLIIYNSYDYIKGLCDLDKSILYRDETIDLIPSTIKKEPVSLLLSSLLDDLKYLMKEEEEDLGYENLLLIYEEDFDKSLDSQEDSICFIDLRDQEKNDGSKRKMIFEKLLNFLRIK